MWTELGLITDNDRDITYTSQSTVPLHLIHLLNPDLPRMYHRSVMTRRTMEAILCLARHASSPAQRMVASDIRLALSEENILRDSRDIVGPSLPSALTPPKDSRLEQVSADYGGPQEMEQDHTDGTVAVEAEEHLSPASISNQDVMVSSVRHRDLNSVYPVRL